MMNEDFLHYLWKYKKINFLNLKTTQQEKITLQHVGVHNKNSSGPDFFNARLIIGTQKWAGNVEIHKKSSDWYLHNHHEDSAYDNVILHVVWEDDVAVFRKDNSMIPTLELKNYIPISILSRYKDLFEKNNQLWIGCEKQLPRVSSFVIENWKEKLYVERLEQKSTTITTLLQNTANNWESVCFMLLTQGFGLKTNKDSFLSLAQSFDFSVFRKCSDNLQQIEALLFGQSGLLDAVQHCQNEEYVKALQKEYGFLKTKFKLCNKGVLPFYFFRLRPSNFPTIRLAQLAMLYFKNNRLFETIIKTQNIEDIYSLFNISTSGFWENHYTFDKKSKKKIKKLTRSFVNLLIINVIFPMRFLYLKNTGQYPDEHTFKMVCSLPPEKNTIIDSFKKLNLPIANAMHSQALLQLKNAYCDQKACLNCEIGNYLLTKG